MSESNAHVNLSSLAIDFDDEPMPQRVVMGRTAEPPVQAYRDAIRDSFKRVEAGEKIKPPRLFVPVERKEISVRDTTRKDKTGGDIVTSWEQHPNIVGVLNRLRKAADAEGLGVQIKVDYDLKDGVNKLRLNRGKDGAPDTVRVRFVGKTRKVSKGAKKASA